MGMFIELLVLAGVAGVIHALYSRIVDWAAGGGDGRGPEGK